MAGRYKKSKDILSSGLKKKKAPLKPLPEIVEKKPEYDPTTLKPKKVPEKPTDPALLAATYEKKIYGDKENDIGEIWKQQEQIRKEDKRLEEAYKLTKKRAKILKNELKKRSKEDDALNAKGVLGSEKAEKLSQVTRTVIKPLGRMTGLKKIVLKQKKPIVLAILASVAIGGVMFVASVVTSESTNQTVTSIQGDEDTPGNTFTPSFSLVLPSGKTLEQLGGVRVVSPPGKPATYAFIDTLNSVEIQVSQQEVPDGFQDNLATEVQRIARDFQANNIIQVDQTTVYYGIQEKSGIQSLVFSKNDRLIFIVSPEQLEDSEWAGYIATLK